MKILPGLRSYAPVLLASRRGCETPGRDGRVSFGRKNSLALLSCVRSTDAPPLPVILHHRHEGGDTEIVPYAPSCCDERGITGEVRPYQRGSTMTFPELAGKPAPRELLVNVPRLISAYYTQTPDPDRPRPAGRLRHVGPPGDFAQQHLQRASHPGDLPGHRRVSQGGGHYRAAVPRHGHARPVRAGADHRPGSVRRPGAGSHDRG